MERCSPTHTPTGRMDEAIEEALVMPEEEQRDRMSRMTDAVENYTVKTGLKSSWPVSSGVVA